MFDVHIDLNCDLGEGFGAWKMGDDEAILPYISSANVACGFHAGDPRIMDETVRRAKALGVAVGAHPSFPDRVGFGRRNLSVSPEEAYSDVLYQIGALSAFCRGHGVRLNHVKPHGQLYNLAMVDNTLADAIVRAVHDFDAALIVVSQPGALARQAEDRGLKVAYEGYADREYTDQGQLVSRSVAGSVITDESRMIDRALKMVKEGYVVTMDGKTIPVAVDTICLHGDTPGATQLAQRLYETFNREGITVMSLAPSKAG